MRENQRSRIGRAHCARFGNDASALARRLAVGSVASTSPGFAVGDPSWTAASTGSLGTSLGRSGRWCYSRDGTAGSLGMLGWGRAFRANRVGAVTLVVNSAVRGMLRAKGASRTGRERCSRSHRFAGLTARR
jgi:hypothetical protein